MPIDHSIWAIRVVYVKVTIVLLKHKTHKLVIS